MLGEPRDRAKRVRPTEVGNRAGRNEVPQERAGCGVCIDVKAAAMKAQDPSEPGKTQKHRKEPFQGLLGKLPAG